MIKILKKTVSDKIAAGEVIEKPLSVVKELVENSVDAGASSIVVEIKKGGSELIRVTDDGAGIEDGEVETAFLRHATSKIEQAEDLERLETLGFRGEALASIAAVSKTEMLTKRHDARVGTRLEIEGGDPISKGPIGCPDGTTIMVRDLFYNTPARKKFMRSHASETNEIIEFVRQMALAYPGIKFRMISNGSIFFSTRGTGDRYEAILTISGRHMREKLLPVENEEGALRLEGYVSGPGDSRSSRRGQTYFVNGRAVSSKVMEKGVDAAYRERLFSGRYPICYLFLEVSPDALDVNIHPNKREVRFDDDKLVTDFIEESIKKALVIPSSVPDIRDLKPAGAPLYQREFTHAGSAGEKESGAPSYQGNFTGAGSAGEKSDAKSFKDHIKEADRSRTVDNKKIPDVEPLEEQVDLKNLLSNIRDENNRARESITQYREDFETAKTEDVFDFSKLAIKGVIFDTYIIGQYEDDFYLIDQHAAHERVFFEEIRNRLRSSEPKAQEIIAPIVFDCRREGLDWAVPLEEFGFAIAEFGPGTFAARAIPIFFGLKEAEDFLNDFVDHIDELGRFESEELKDAMATRACKAAVKANDVLKPEEISKLLESLSACENPYSCPHGRPTSIRMTKREIEKRFKRIV